MVVVDVKVTSTDMAGDVIDEGDKYRERAMRETREKRSGCCDGSYH